MHDIREGARLDDRRWLLLGQSGERWLTEPLPDRPEQAQASKRGYWAAASSYRAPELLTHLARVAGKWLFVGASGAVYRSSEPLGRLELLATAPEAFLDVAKTGDGLAAVNALGELYRFEADGWRRSSASTWRIFDLAAGGDGRLLGLALPEKLLLSDDGAKTFSPLAGASIGAYQLLPTQRADAVLVRAAAGNQLWTSGDDKLQPVGAARARALPTDGKLALRAQRGPSADAIADSRAALTGLRYYEAFEDVDALDCEDDGACSDDGRRNWFLLAGRIDQSLQRKPLPWAGRCDSIRIGASHKQVVAACITPGSGLFDVQLHRSADAGASWTTAGQLGTADMMALTVAVAPDGSALLSEACEPRGKGCASGELMRLDGSSHRLSPARARGLVGPAGSPCFSFDGTMAYFVGRRTKNNELALFVSEDGGDSFSAQRIASARKGQPHSFFAAWGRADVDQVSLHPGSNGELGLALHNGEMAHYAVVNIEGEIQQLARLDGRVAALAGQGRSILAASTTHSRLGVQQVALKLSINGGEAFRDLPLPFSLARDELSEGMGVACGSVGCVIGTRLTRLSWASEAGGHRLSDAHLLLDVPSHKPDVRTPIVCSVDDKRDWATLDSLEWVSGPESYELFRADSAWAVLRHRRDSGQVLVTNATSGPARAKLKDTVLLAAAADKSSWSYYLAKQNEGFVALRAPSATLSPPTKGQLEMAWADLIRNKTGKGKLKNIAAYQPAERTPGPTSYLLPGLVSISPEGLFVQPHASNNGLSLVNPRGKVTASYKLFDWKAEQLYTTAEATVVGGQAIGIAAQGRQPGLTEVMRAAVLGKNGRPAASTSLTIALRHDSGSIVETRWTQLDGAPGMTAHFADPGRRSRAFAFFVPIKTNGQLGPAQPVATQQDVGDLPRPCSDKELKTARFIAPSLPGTRHPVIIDGVREGMMTTEAVVYGSKDSPCVRGWLAQTHHQDIPEWSMRAVIPVSGKSAWLLRRSKTPKALDYRPISCIFSATAPIPNWVRSFEMTQRMPP